MGEKSLWGAPHCCHSPTPPISQIQAPANPQEQPPNLQPHWQREEAKPAPRGETEAQSPTCIHGAWVPGPRERLRCERADKKGITGKGSLKKPAVPRVGQNNSMSQCFSGQRCTRLVGMGRSMEAVQGHSSVGVTACTLRSAQEWYWTSKHSTHPQAKHKESQQPHATQHPITGCGTRAECCREHYVMSISPGDVSQFPARRREPAARHGASKPAAWHGWKHNDPMVGAAPVANREDLHPHLRVSPGVLCASPWLLGDKASVRLGTPWGGSCGTCRAALSRSGFRGCKEEGNQEKEMDLSLLLPDRGT